jgi:hypothetical protein
VVVVHQGHRRLFDDPAMAPGHEGAQHGHQVPAGLGEVTVEASGESWYCRRSRTPAASSAFDRADNRSRSAP